MGMPILADELEVLTELQSQLAINGVYRFRKFRRIPQHIQFSCPFHKDGQEMNPSCGITTEDIKYANGRVVKAGSVHCFTCGYTSNLETMISRLFGHEDFGTFGAEWLKKNFLSVEFEDRPEIPLDLERNTAIRPQRKYVSEEELDSYRYIHPYMYKRKLTDEVIEMFDVGYDANFKLNENSDPIPCITFPVRDMTGGTLFIARRAVNSKMFHYPSGAEKPLYGIYELSLFETYPSEVIICESIINCLTCYTYGKYAIALNGTGSAEQIEQLKTLPCRKFVLGLDPDDAGNNGRKKIRYALKGNKLFSDLIIPIGKDINDLTKEEFDSLDEVF